MVALDIKSKYPMMFMSERFIFYSLLPITVLALHSPPDAHCTKRNVLYLKGLR